MDKKRIILIVSFIIFSLLNAYLVFMSFQGVLTLISKEFNLILPFIGPLCLFVELTGLTIILYKVVFKKINNKKKFYFANGLYLLINGFLSTLFMLINIITYKNWQYGGPTLLYPFDFLIMALLGLGLGIHFMYRYIKRNYEEEKENKDELVIIKIGKAIYTFIALDRLGCMISSIIFGEMESFIFMLPLYLLCLIPFAYIIMVTLEDKLNRVGKLIFSYSLLGVWALTNIYLILMLNGNDRSFFVKITSPFYGIDSLISMPITMILVSLIAIAPFVINGISTIFLLIKKRQK